MLPNEIFDAMETLSKQDLVKMCRKYKINTKIKTYDSNRNIVMTKNDYCVYDLIKLIKAYFINKDSGYSIIYYDYNPRQSLNSQEDILITFRNVKKIYPIIRKLYKKSYNTNFHYDKITYNILSNKWQHGDSISIREFMNEHFYSKKNSTVPIYLADSKTYEKTKKQIISTINEYIELKYN